MCQLLTYCRMRTFTPEDYWKTIGGLDADAVEMDHWEIYLEPFVESGAAFFRLPPKGPFRATSPRYRTAGQHTSRCASSDASR